MQVENLTNTIINIFLLLLDGKKALLNKIFKNNSVQNV